MSRKRLFISIAAGLLLAIGATACMSDEETVTTLDHHRRRADHPGAVAEP